MMNKRIFATLVAMGMVASMGTMAVSAEDPPTTGSSATYTDAGKVEDIIDTSIVTATLPAIDDGTFDFILDPQQLLAKTAGTGASGNSLGAAGTNTITGTLLFENATNTYGETSAEVVLEFVNAVDTDVTVAATLAQTGNLKFSTSDDFGVTLQQSTNADADKKAAEIAQGKEDATAHVYLAISDTTTAGSPINTALEATGGKYTKPVDAIVPAKLKVAYAGGKYSYDAEDADKSVFKFKLTGKTNAAADGWDALKDVTPSIDLTWTLKKHVDSYLSQTSITSSDLTVEFDAGKPAEASVDKIEAYNGGTLNKVLTSSHYTVTTTGIKFSTGFTDYYTGQTLKVTFSDGTVNEITVG